MNVTLDLTGASPSLVQRSDDADDSRLSILADVCDALEDSKCGALVVEGFGESRWQLDLRTDLLTLLEQLPPAIAAARNGEWFVLDFFEQGTERTLRFEPNGTEYVVKGEAYVSASTPWTPPPEQITSAALHDMLATVLRVFMQFLEKCAPEIAAHPSIRAWAARADE